MKAFYYKPLSLNVNAIFDNSFFFFFMHLFFSQDEWFEEKRIQIKQYKKSNTYSQMEEYCGKILT